MPPSSQRRTRTRKVNDVQERSDADDVDSVSTPSRKRRRVNNREYAASPNAIVGHDSRTNNARRGKSRPSDAKGSEDEPSESSAEEDINFVIRNLRSAKHNIQARVDYANEVHEVTYPQGKQAYAKIAGNGWTFYVDILQVRIGRPPDGRQGEVSQGFSDADGDTSLVHIDLGPSKHVSRQHAEIRYDDNSRNWYIVVNGRNGVKLDETPLRRGETATLNSGSVVDVAGTQMIFITPNDEPAVHPAIWAQTRATREGNEEEDEDDFDTIGAPPAPQRTPNQSQSSRFNHNRPSSGRDNQSGRPSSSKGQSQHLQASLTLGRHDGSYDSRSQSSHTKQKTSPPFSKMILEQSDDIDYAQDSAKDLKPPHSYAQLIGMAILSSLEEKLTLSKIYDWIKERYAFYRHSGGGWQNSIRHNLSLNKCFEKVARRTDEPGKGMKWQIVPEHRDEFLKKGLNNPRKIAGRSSSGPNSPVKTTAPSSMDNPFSQDYQQDLSRPSKSLMKTSPDSTPPLSHYPASKQAYTPDRAGNILSQLQGGNTSSPRNDVLSGISPLPFTHRKPRAGGLNEIATAASPSGPAMLLNSDPNDNLITPLFTRHAPRLAPPSTAHLPSQFMPMSSPAPFWKYAEFGSTPARPGIDVSPAKGLYANGSKLETHPELTSGKRPSIDEKLSAVRSSSPPVPEGEVGSGSPTKALSHRGTEPSSQQLAKGQPAPPQPTFAPPPRGGIQPSGSPGQEDEDDEEEEGMIDLARGFQPIGSFHRNMSAGIRGN